MYCNILFYVIQYSTSFSTYVHMDIQYTQNTLFVHFLLLDTMLLAEINRIFLQKESLISPLSYVCKGHLISKWFFGVFDFFKKLNENKSTWGIIVVKSNSFVHFLEESAAWKNHYDFVWPLVTKMSNKVQVFGEFY